MKPLLEQHGLPSLTALVSELCKASPGSAIFKDCIHVLTTHETSFFRGNRQYEFLRNHVFPGLLEMELKNKRLAIWSGACSTGQELYTVAMIIHKHFPEMLSWDLHLDGTDISENAVKAARKGEYNNHEITRGLPQDYLDEFFTQTENDNYVINGNIRKSVDYRCMNLAGKWSCMPPYHIIFMRNVMVYFDDETKRKILEKLKLYLHSNGILVLGSAEAMFDMDPDWKMICEEGITYYRLNEN